MHVGFCEGLHSQFDTALMEVSFFQADRLEDFTGSVDEVCIFFSFGQIVKGDTGLNQSPSLLPDPTSPHSTSCLIFIR